MVTRSLAQLSCMSILIIASAGPAMGTTYSVSTTEDVIAADGFVSLREAVRAANLNAIVNEAQAGSSSAADVIILPAGIYLLTLVGAGENAALTGDLDVTNNSAIVDLQIIGAGSALSVIDGNGTDRIFHVFSGTTIEISDLALTNGVVTGANLDGGAFQATVASTTVRRCLISNNSSGSRGGGVDIDGGTFVAFECTFQGNAALVNSGGGLFSVNASSSLTNCTFSGNTASTGGAITNNSNGGNSSLTLINCTIVQNGAASGGGGVRTRQQSAGTFSTTLLTNTIVADNTPSDFAVLNVDAGHATVLTNGGNLVGSNAGVGVPFPAGSPNANGDFVGTSASRLNPRLSQLDSGWSVPIHIPLCGSLAVDGGTSLGAPADDARGYARPLDGDADSILAFDIGAVERAASDPVLSPPDSPNATPPEICQGRSAALTANVPSGVVIDWFTDGCGASPVATGNPIFVSPVETTIYFASAREAATGCASGSCVEVTLVVDPLLPLPEFVEVLLGTDVDPEHRCLADGNHDGVENGDDIPSYIVRLIGS